MNPITIKDQWDAWGVSDEKWNHLKAKALSARKVWLFSKGKSFNDSFAWSLLVDHKQDFKIAINESAMFVQAPDLVITYDHEVRKYLFNEGFEDIMISAKRDEWLQASMTGDFALTVIGELGIKEITAVGLDYGYNENGFNYAFPSLGHAHIADKGKRCCMAVCEHYGIKINYFKK